MEDSSNHRKKRSQRDYTMAFKLLVIGQVERGEFTYKQAQKHYGIQGRSTVLTWLRKHGNLEWNTPNLYAMSKGKETPEQKIKRLEREINDLKTVNMLNEAIINRVDELTGSDFGKKLEAKYSEYNKSKKK
jgi:transposase-like protein